MPTCARARAPARPQDRKRPIEDSVEPDIAVEEAGNAAYNLRKRDGTKAIRGLNGSPYLARTRHGGHSGARKAGACPAARWSAAAGTP